MPLTVPAEQQGQEGTARAPSARTAVAAQRIQPPEAPMIGEMGDVPAGPGEVDYEGEQTRLAAFDVQARSNKTITVSRRVIYTQGVLLAIVATIAFVLGMLFEGARRANSPASTPPEGPISLRGQAIFKTASGARRPDAGSTILAVPADMLPDEKLQEVGLRPEDPQISNRHATLQALLALGGAYGRADDLGHCRLRLPRRGEYFVLCISANARRDSRQVPAIKDMAQLGRYFHSAMELIGDRQYRWMEKSIKNDTTIDWEFDRSTD